MTSRLSQIHNLCIDIAGKSLSDRLKVLSRFFIETDYGFWPDGSSLESLDDFDYSLNILDCVTFVEVALALAKTEPLADFKEFKQEFENILRLIHYANGQPNFVSRNHFMSVDWILNNKFIVEDVTLSLSDKAQMAEALIDKLTWIKRHKINKDANTDLPESVVKKFQPQISRLPYIETEELLQNHSRFQDNFPEYCIVNIVRPNWDLTEKIGTHLNVSHLGFTFKDPLTKQLSFYHASNDERMKVVGDNLYDYMNRFRDSPTIKGINVLVITPGYHHAR